MEFQPHANHWLYVRPLTCNMLIDIISNSINVCRCYKTVDNEVFLASCLKEYILSKVRIDKFWTKIPKKS